MARGGSPAAAPQSRLSTAVQRSTAVKSGQIREVKPGPVVKSGQIDDGQKWSN